jgi:hypothetical protein
VGQILQRVPKKIVKPRTEVFIPLAVRTRTDATLSAFENAAAIKIPSFFFTQSLLKTKTSGKKRVTFVAVVLLACGGVRF